MKHKITAIALGALFIIFSLLMLTVKDKPADVIKTKDADDKEIYREYVDENGELVTLSSGYAAYSIDRDSKGRAYKVTYLDKEKKPVKISSGYIIVLRTFNDADKIETEMYYDADGNQVQAKGGYYGLYFDRDEDGRAKLTQYLGADGNPVITSMGYAMIARTFDEDGKTVSERYLDQNGEPIALARGQYGVRYYKGKAIYLGKNGRDKFELMNFLKSYPASVFIIGAILTLLALIVKGKQNYVFLTIYGLFIIYMTLMMRDQVTNRLILDPFWSYKQFFTNKTLRIEILDNIWMFVPLGAFLYNMDKRIRVVFIPILVSVLIELTQLVFGVGLCEIDDVISNGLGGIIGILFCKLYTKK